jgi:metallo-beta-lactamase family protein
MSVKITFLGASETVTGSKYLVTGSSSSVLVDAGLFQGEKSWREKNWINPSFALDKLSAVCLTHAHIDHIGLLPRFVKLGLNAPVYSHDATYELAKLLLIDSAMLQEEEAAFRARKGRSRHTPPQPLYNKRDAEESLKLFNGVVFEKRIQVAANIFATWFPAGHLLGAASIKLEVDDKVITFSGDLGRNDDPIVNNPVGHDFGNLLLIESTYGNREHLDTDVESKLVEEIEYITKTKGVILIPSFAIGRSQRILYHLKQLKDKKLIPDLPIYVDSPMAREATKIYLNFQSDLKPELLASFNEGSNPILPKNLIIVNSRDDSKRLNTLKGPAIIISASGMLTGGRVLHHLCHRITGEENTVLFAGHQPKGGKGFHLLNGGDTLRIFNETFPVKCRISKIENLSAHADQSELIDWCSRSSIKPAKVAVVHGEVESANELADKLRAKLSWNVELPKYGETWTV